MDVLFWIVGIAAWLGCGHVAIALRRGWRYYDLLNYYEDGVIRRAKLNQLERANGVGGHMYAFGLCALIAAVAVYGTKPKWQ